MCAAEHSQARRSVGAHLALVASPSRQRGEFKRPDSQQNRTWQEGRGYLRQSNTLLILNFGLLVLIASGVLPWLPLWCAALLPPLLLARQFLAFHELMHISPETQVSAVTRLFAVLETPLSLGYAQLRKIHLSHHRHAASPQDPEWFQIRGGALRAFVAASLAPEMAFIGWVRREGWSKVPWGAVLLRAALIALVLWLSLHAYLFYWVGVRLTIALSEFSFHHLLHHRAGQYGTFALQLPAPLRGLIGLLVGYSNLPIVLHHDAHHQWPLVHARHLATLLQPPSEAAAARLEGGVSSHS